MSKKETSSAARRRRDRRASENRIPSILAERRAREAQYEQEQRNETAVAMAELTDVMDRFLTMPQAELVAYFVARLQKLRAEKEEAMENIRRIRLRKADLMDHVAIMEDNLCCRQRHSDEIPDVYHYNTGTINQDHIQRNVNHEPQNTNDELEDPERNTLDEQSYSNDRDSNVDN